MKKVFAFLFAGYCIDLIFTLIEWNQTTMGPGFPFRDINLLLSAYVYYYCQHASIMCLLAAAYFASGWKLFTWLLILEAFDTLDYALTFNSPYFSGYEFDFNWIKVFVVAYLIYIQWKRLTSLGKSSE